MTNLTKGDHRCLVCGTPDSDKVQIYRGEDWCSENHRKVITNERTKEQDPEAHASMREGVAMRFFSLGPVRDSIFLTDPAEPKPEPPPEWDESWDEDVEDLI